MRPPVIGVTGHAEESLPRHGAPVLSVGQSYVHAVVAGGGAPVVVAPLADEGYLRAVLGCLDGLLLSGGGDLASSWYGERDGGLLRRVDKGRDAAELTLARWALEEGLPLLAICRGIQVLNVAAGGSLIQDVGTQIANALDHTNVAGRPMTAIAHTVDVVDGTRLADLFGAGQLEVNSAHHQAAATVGGGLVVAARAPDGVIEGLELPDHPFCVGVQWHPEAMIGFRPAMVRLFEALAGAARMARE